MLDGDAENIYLNSAKVSQNAFRPKPVFVQLSLSPFLPAISLYQNVTILDLVGAKGVGGSGNNWS